MQKEVKLAMAGGKPVRKKPFPKYPVFGNEEIKAAIRVIKSGKLCAQVGKEVEAFEREFAAYHGIGHAIAVSNGTTALHTAIAACGIGVGDEVIVPPYTFLATATSVLMQNAIPVFADIERETLGLDARCVEKNITRNTRGIIIVHMNGYPAAHLEEILEMAKRRKIFIIEDCSHAHGAEYKGKKAGTFGDISIFSFQQKKNLSLGEGGMIITPARDLDEKARAFRAFGNLPLAYNYRMTELHGAIGRVRLKQLDRQNAVRRKNAEYLDKKLTGIRGIVPQLPHPGTKPVYYNYVVKYNEKALGVSRKDFIAAIEAEGIPLPLIYTPLYRHPTFQIKDAYNKGCPFSCPYYKYTRKPVYEDGACPVAEETCDRANIEIKIHPPAATNDMADIVKAFKKVAAVLQEQRRK